MAKASNSGAGRLALRGTAPIQGELRLEWLGSRASRELRVEIEAVGSLFPFGFLKKQIGTDVQVSAIVWPAPVEYRRFAAATRAVPKRATGRPAGNGGDLAAFCAAMRRRFASPHPLKASGAQPTSLLVRQFSAENIERYSLWLRTDASVWTRPSNSNCSSVLPRPSRKICSAPGA